MAREAIGLRRLAIANELILRALPRARTDSTFPAWVTRTLSGDRRFGSRDRRFYRELIYTAVRFLPWIESVRETNRALAALWLAADTPETHDARVMLLPATRQPAHSPEALGAQFRDTFPGAAAGPQALLPDWVADECPALLDPTTAMPLHSRAPLWLRARGGDTAGALDALAAESIVAAADDRIAGAIRFQSGPDVTRSRAYASGIVEVQDIGSQWVLHTAAPSPGERCLDACAGAGGKTLQLADLVGTGTPVVAHDIRPAALDELQARAKRAGIDSLHITRKVEGEFDAVLVDAPCSGSGTWRRSPHLKWQTTREHLRAFAARQFELLRAFAPHVRPGGRLVYATCSLALTENEGTVRTFLAADPRFAAATPGADPVGAALLPWALDSDAFYVSVLLRGGF